MSSDDDPHKKAAPGQVKHPKDFVEKYYKQPSPSPPTAIHVEQRVAEIVSTPGQDPHAAVQYRQARQPAEVPQSEMIEHFMGTETEKELHDPARAAERAKMDLTSVEGTPLLQTVESVTETAQALKSKVESIGTSVSKAIDSFKSY